MKTWIIKLAVGHLVVLALILGVIGSKFGWFTPENEPEVRIDCPIFSEGCLFSLDKENYQVKSQEPLSANKPVQLLVTGKAKSIHASWQMQDMEMGPNNYRLLSHDQQHWHAQTALPFCTNKRQDWLLKLDIDGRRINISTVSS
ncbi:hypothetical protein [Iodobacter ciconiae]|uniref:Uncharacterized protein n=1 Tax=Iodobacter ciconiae TaxID=2496266 RepID=A0A3S8ZQ38_9NEIS|nr:hypothetical protein [Iodobacter ciconiae]AZN35584.1 hypothetical protein EJO50_03230 [Iodobacter ciconiae]